MYDQTIQTQLTVIRGVASMSRLSSWMTACGEPKSDSKSASDIEWVSKGHTEGIGNDKINTDFSQPKLSFKSRHLDQSNTIREDIRPSLSDIHHISIDAVL